MNEPQVWTLIGVFAAGLFGMMTLMSTMFVRVIKTEIGGLRGELSGDIKSLRGELSGLRAEMAAEFRGVHQRIDRLDSDVNALMKHAFGVDRD